jgi:membrane-associated phospholipid phosphatase
MQRRLRWIEARVLPRGWTDALKQLLLGVAAYMSYELVRAVADGRGTYKPFGDATNIIHLERTFHVFVEPTIQAWTSSVHWLMNLADWTYLNAHYFVTLGALLFIYLRRNDSFYFVRNMFMIAMAIALVGYALYPTAPPRLMPEWGFTDSISRFLGVPQGGLDDGPAKAITNLYAAVPSMHVCFALMVGWPMARLSRHRASKIAWALYPVLISFVVIATGNHYLIDVFLGALTAGASAFLAERLLARAKPDKWAFQQAAA